MTKISCVIIDDEPLAVKLLFKYASNIDFLDVKATFNNSLKALNYIEQNYVDLIFLDINMPDLNGLDLAKIRNNNSKIIFTTAYAEYAIDGFKLEAIDYLLKPIRFTDFFNSANRAKRYLQNKDCSDIENFITVKSDYKTIKINTSDIVYIESIRDYLNIVEKNESTISRMTLKNIELILPQNFMRVNKSFIVNLNHIREVAKNRIIFGKTYIPIGDKYRDEFYDFFNKNNV